MDEMKCFHPHPALEPYVQSYVSLKLPQVLSQPAMETTPPLPTKAIMFWFSKTSFRVYNRYKMNEENPRAFIIPQYTCPNSCIHYGANEFFTITFWPGKMRHLFRFPWLEVLNHYIPIEDTGDQSFIDFSHRIEDTPSLTDRVQICDDFLLSRLPKSPTQLDGMQYVVNNLMANPKLKVRDLAKKMFLSERQFRRRYKETFGITPAGHRRLFRFLKAYNWLKKRPADTLMDATEQFGYTDPSHLYKDFLHYTDESPIHYMKKTLLHKYTNWRENYWD